MAGISGPESAGEGQNLSFAQALRGGFGPGLKMIPLAVQYYEYAAGDPNDMGSLMRKIRDETPALAGLRDAFSDHIVDLSENLQWPLTNEEAPKIVQGEFDITLLTFFMSKDLKEPLRTLDALDELAKGFAETVATTDVNALDKIMPELSNRCVSLWTLSAGLRQNALRRITRKADCVWSSDGIQSLSYNKQTEYYSRRYAQQMCVLTIARSLGMLD